MTAPCAVVTGASSGIGWALAERLVAAGWRVIGISRRDRVPAGVEWLGGDLADPASVRDVAERARRAVGDRVHALVHAAGLQSSARLEDLSPEAGERMWQVHVHAPQVLASTLLPSMADRGRILLVGSRTMSGVPGKSQYAATKAALPALARSWAAELAPRGITVNVVAPGPTDTAMLADPARAATPPRVPALGRLVRPEEVADLALFLLGPAGDMITGQTVVICGGASLPG